MPARVPDYSQPTAQPQDLPGVRQQTPFALVRMAGMGGAELQRDGQQMTSGASDLGRIAIADQSQKNEIDAKQADANFVQQADAVLYGQTGQDGSFTPGFTQLKGSQAVNAAPTTVQALQKLAQQTSDNATNDASRQMVQQVIAQRMNAYSAAVAKHAGAQQIVADHDASNLRMQAAADSAKKAYDPLVDQTATYNADDGQNPTRSLYQQQLGTAQTELQNQAKYLPADAQAQFVKDGMEKIYAGIAVHLANIGQPQQAKAYLGQLQQGDAISQDTADKVQKIIAPNLTADRVLSYTDHLFDTTKDYASQMRQVRSDFENGTIDGRERELIESRVKQQKNQQQSDDNRYEAAAVGQAQDYFIKNPGKGILDLAQDNPSLYRALENKGHLGAMDAFSQRQDRAGPTDPTLYHNVVQNFGTGNDKDITRMSDADWMLVAGQMSDPDRKRFDQERAAAINGTPASRNDPGSLHVSGFKDALGSRLAGIGVDLKKETDKSYAGALQQYASEWVLNDQMAAGHRFNQQETQQSLNKLFATDVNFRNTFLGVGMGTSSMPLLKMKIGDVPSAAAEGIRQDLARSGKTPTDQDVLMQYWRLHAKH